MSKFLSVFIFCFIFFSPKVFSQQVTGTIKNSSTGTPMAFVSVNIKGTKEGTLSDIDGHFAITVPSDTNVIVFSYVGFFDQELKPSKNNKQAVTILMKVNNQDLEAVIISNGENPAFRIIRRMQENKNENDPEKQSSFSYNAYTLAAMKAGRKFWNIATRTLGKRTAEKVIREKDTAKTSYKSMLARRFKENYLFVSEAYSKRIYKNPKLSKETVLATKFSGFKEAPLAITATNFQPFGFYKDYIFMNNDSYLSPVADGSINFYKFHLDKIIPHAKDTSYVISFTPKEGKNFNGLTGIFFINSDKYALETVTAKPSDEHKHSVTFSLLQKYERVKGNWFPVQQNASLIQKDLKTDSVILAWDSRTYLSNVLFDVPLSVSDFNEVTLDYAPGAGNQKSDSAWQLLRPDTMDTRAMNTYKTYDLLPKKTKFVFNSLNYIFKAFTIGAIPLGKVDLPFNYFICGVNQYETYRFGAGFQTNESFNKILSFGGYAGYGLSDKAWKYGGNITAYTKPDRSSFFRLKYKQDLQETGIVPWFDGNYSLYSFQTIRNFLASQFDSVQRLEVNYHTKIVKDLSTDIWLAKEKNHPAGYDALFNPGANSLRSYQYSEAGIGFNYHKGETYTKIGNAKILTRLANTQLLVQATTTLHNFWNNDLDFTKLALQFTQRFKIKRLGETAIDFAAGKIWGDVPYGKLFDMQGASSNGSLSYIPFHFQTVGLYEFTADMYAGLFIEHNFGHLLFKPKNVHFQPELLLTQDIEYGSLRHPEYLAKVGATSPAKGLFESGIMLKNVYRHKFFSLFYLGIGGGVFFRYGSYALPGKGDNVAYKFGINFSQ